MRTSVNLWRRAAVRIHERIVTASRHQAAQLPHEQWQRCLDLARKIERAEQQGWPLAAARLRKILVTALEVLCVRTAEALRQLQTATTEPRLRDLLAELLALDREFDHTRCDLREGIITVTTPPIELEGVFLGAFEIRLDWQRLDHHRAYEVVACEPNPAAASQDTTHPHVQSALLCEGEGRLPLRQALREGRLCDFFLIVSRILQTYNAESAYVPLSDWDGIACSDCGEVVSQEESGDCYRCGSALCSGCSVWCQSCDETHCNSCLETCAGCETSLCRNCRNPCRRCGGNFCHECLVDRLCETCRLPEEEKPEAETPAPENAPVLADRVGQTAVPA